MIFWERADGEGMIRISDELYKRACDLGLGVPSKYWHDDEVLDFIKDPEAFEKKYAYPRRSSAAEPG